MSIAALNDQALQETYIRCNSRPSIRRYLLKDNMAGNDVAQRITQFLVANPQLLPTFPIIPPSDFQREVMQKKYLVIYKSAVSLTEERDAPIETEPRFKDIFTETLLHEPIRCSQSHSLERSLAAVWVATKGDVCPFGPHSIGPLAVDEELQYDIIQFRAQNEKREETLRAQQAVNVETAKEVQALKAKVIDLSSEKEIASQIIQYQSAKINALSLCQQKFSAPLNRAIVPYECLKLTGKVVWRKCGEKALQKAAEELIKKGSTKLIGKAASKIIPIYGPIVSIGTGVALGTKRFCDGQYIKAVIEIGSGFITLIPIYGPIASIAIDGCLLASDIAQMARGDIIPSKNLAWAYKVLNLDPKGAPYTKVQVDAAIRVQMQGLHPDGVTFLGAEISAQNVEILEEDLNLAIKILYKENNWN